MPGRPTGRAPRLRAGRGLRGSRAQKVVETKVVETKTKLVMAYPQAVTVRKFCEIWEDWDSFRNNETKKIWEDGW